MPNLPVYFNEYLPRPSVIWDKPLTRKEMKFYKTKWESERPTVLRVFINNGSWEQDVASLHGDAYNPDIKQEQEFVKAIFRATVKSGEFQSSVYWVWNETKKMRIEKTAFLHLIGARLNRCGMRRKKCG